MQRRHALALLALPLLAACAGGQGTDYRIGGYEVGFGDRIHSAALRAPWEFGDLSRWQGQPGRAALAVADLEILTDGLARDPYWSPETPPDVVALLGRARAAVRARLGIEQGAPPALVVAALLQAADALETGRASLAPRALEQPGFRQDGPGTLGLLASLPRLPETSTAANAAAAEIARRAGGTD
ncbi:hypothetical protein CR162_02885 [Pseudoroseomonas rhizosphaerae]|uniref:Uncharacterized protein n=1 Tax=Teichococcus rhizosphaerae TaxID=1335062 RepID=A0A2C7AFQ9_9PROT|nr:hypothetical protein [Pseudoroseomonas rhizosphaerae]PHK96305.1 hypothetical protein CR162_02885 [Pseudoroseomonas rhizosphaerae]